MGAMNKVITKAGTHTLQAAPAAGYVLEILWGQFSVRAANTVTFDYVDPPLVEDATSGRDIGLPPSTLLEGQPCRVTTCENAKTTIKWTSRIVAVTVPPQPPTTEPVNCVVGEWGPWSEWMPISPTVESRMRTRAIVTPPANGGAACPSLTETETRPIQAPGTKRLLRLSDLTHLGCMRVPSSGVYMDFSYGALTGRVVNGEQRLIMSGNKTGHDVPACSIYEFTDTGVYDMNPWSAPRMPLVTTWGDIYGDKRKSWLPDGTERTYQKEPGGLLWNEETKLLYWTYWDSYNVNGYEDWCLGASSLNSDGTATAYGPWRPAGDGKKGPWRCVRIAASPSGELICGSGVMSGNSSSPWGPDLWAGAFPVGSTAGGYGAPDIPIQKYLTYPPMIGKINPDGTFNGPLLSCRRPTYVWHANPFTLTEINPDLNGGVGSWTQLDGLGGAIWIDLPGVHGVLFNGKLAAGHIWYRNEGMGSGLCSHGLEAVVGAGVTGPVSTDAYPVMMFYSPDDVMAVRGGTKIDYTVDPIEIVNIDQAMPSVVTAPLSVMGSTKTLAGQYFNPETRKLYIAAPDADNTINGLLNPLIHVFQVAG